MNTNFFSSKNKSKNTTHRFEIKKEFGRTKVLDDFKAVTAKLVFVFLFQSKALNS